MRSILTRWLWFQAAIDVAAAVVFIAAPQIVLAQIAGAPEGHPLWVRFVGVAALALSLGYGLAARSPNTRVELLFVTNTVRAAGGLGLMLSAMGDPTLPLPFRLSALGEWTFLAVTLTLQRAAGVRFMP